MHVAGPDLDHEEHLQSAQGNRAHPTFGPSRPNPTRPVLRPLLTSARSARLAARAVGAAATTAQPTPGQTSPDKNDQSPCARPRLRDGPVDGDGLRLLEQARPDRPASYAIRVPWCRATPRASFPPRLTATQFRGLGTPCSRPFPDEAASLLPGLLAATRTGLTPASDDELTTRDQLHRPPPVIWAHERSRLECGT